MSIFGESTNDRRDYRMGLAGLLAGIHALRILAERGLADQADIIVSITGVQKVLDSIPKEAWKRGERERLDQMLLRIIDAAAAPDGGNG